VNVLQINKEDTQELSVVCVSLGAVADRGTLQGPPTCITLKEGFHANWETRKRYGSTALQKRAHTDNSVVVGTIKFYSHNRQTYTLSLVSVPSQADMRSYSKVIIS
jgi:hypothetical protein